MTTTTTTQKTQKVESSRPVGRPLSKRGRDTKRAVERFLTNTDGQFTVADVRKATKQNKVTVRNRLNTLEERGVIVKVNNAPVVRAGKVVRGRPFAVYQKV